MIESESRQLMGTRRPNNKPRTGDGRTQRSTAGSRSMSAFLPHRKYDHIQKIADVVEELKLRQHNQKSTHAATTIEPQRIVQGFKEKIKANFNQLYENYENNRESIAKQIKLLEKNKTVHTEINQKFEHALKQKGQYDKTHAEVQVCEAKLTKLREVLQKEKAWRLESQQLKVELDARISEFSQCQAAQEELQYQRAVLMNMREDRRRLRNIVKYRFQTEWRRWCQTNKNIDKYWNQTQGKKVMLGDLIRKMPTEVKMPQKLASQLQTKLEQFYGKQAYLNIFQHQTILNQQANRRDQQIADDIKQTIRRQKQEEYLKQKRQYQSVETKLNSFKSEQQKVKKICGVNDIQQISGSALALDTADLHALKEEYDQELAQIKDQNTQLQHQIQRRLSAADLPLQQSLKALNKQKQSVHDQQKRLHNQVQKCNKMLQDLMFIVQRVTQQPGTRKDMHKMLAAFSSKIERVVLIDKMQNKSKKQVRKPSIVAKFNSFEDDQQQVSRLDQQKEYVDNMFRRTKAI